MAELAAEAQHLFHVQLLPQQEQQFSQYAEMLARWNTHTNLTAITEPAAVRVRHFLDSLSIAGSTALDNTQSLIDVGTGAGFPGLPLKIAFPHLHVTLMDSTGKKVAFLDHVIQTLGLTDIETLHARAEDAGRMPAHRARYDMVVARSVARLPALVEYLLPLAKVGGQCVAMKGTTALTEAQDAARAIDRLGGKLNRVDRLTLPDVEDEHFLVFIDKVAPTPASYPRAAGIPTRKPI